jgi:hypothetical protein
MSYIVPRPEKKRIVRTLHNLNNNAACLCCQSTASASCVTRFCGGGGGKSFSSMPWQTENTVGGSRGTILVVAFLNQKSVKSAETEDT